MPRRAVGATYPQDADHLVDRHVEPAVNTFGASDPETADMEALRSDLWARVAASIGTAFVGANQLPAALEACGSAILTAIPDHQRLPVEHLRRVEEPPLHERAAALGRYIASVQAGPDRRRRERDAYVYAKTFREDVLDGDPFFWDLTLRFAVEPFGVVLGRGVDDLHDELVHAMADRGALRRFIAHAREDRREQELQLWRDTLDSPDGPARLLELLSSA